MVTRSEWERHALNSDAQKYRSVQRTFGLTFSTLIPTSRDPTVVIAARIFSFSLFMTLVFNCGRGGVVSVKLRASQSVSQPAKERQGARDEQETHRTGNISCIYVFI